MQSTRLLLRKATCDAPDVDLVDPITITRPLPRRLRLCDEKPQRDSKQNFVRSQEQLVPRLDEQLKKQASITGELSSASRMRGRDLPARSWRAKRGAQTQAQRRRPETTQRARGKGEKKTGQHREQLDRVASPGRTIGRTTCASRDQHAAATAAVIDPEAHRSQQHTMPIQAIGDNSFFPAQRQRSIRTRVSFLLLYPSAKRPAWCLA